MLDALPGAYSQTHIDGAGFCTVIHIAAGSKRWLVARDFPVHPYRKGWREEQMEWEAVYLQSGDDLYVLS